MRESRNQSMSNRNSRRSKKKNYTNLAIFLIAIGVIIFSLSQLIPILIDYKKSANTYDQMEAEYVIKQETEDASLEGNVNENWWYEDIQIDFDHLKGMNPDVVAWIRFDDPDNTRVDYPVMQGSNNDKYLHMNPKNEHASGGSIFLEAENSSDFSDIYNIIYGHNMKDGSMFGTMKKLKRDENFYDDNSYFTLYTPDAAYRYRIFSYRDVPDDSNVYTIGYVNDSAYQTLIDQMVNNSMENTGIHPTQDDRVLTISTCSTSGDNIRFVIHAVCMDVHEY